MPDNINSPVEKERIRIIFMGTPEFAVASLDKLVEANYNIVGVVTAPDKPAGRGLQVNESAVKKFALANNLKLLQPEKLKNPEFLHELKLLNATLQVVVAFRMLPEVVWNMPPTGTINLHGSLLPQYRGAAPINRAIMNGEKETGVTTFKLKQDIDTGDILLQEKIAIGDDETAGELHDRMKEIGAELLLKTVEGIERGDIKSIPQLWSDRDGEPIKNAPKISNETCKIDWSKNVNEIYDLIRGLSPYPAAFTFLNDKMIKIFKAVKEEGKNISEPGQFETDKNTFLKFACSNGYISIRELQLEGRRKNQIEEFLRGFRF